MKQNWVKKAIGVIISLTMVFTSAVPVTEQNLLASSVPYEDIKSTNGGRFSRQTMKNNSAVITVEALTEGSFRTSVVEMDKYITTTSAGESWYSGAAGDEITMENGTAGTNVFRDISMTGKNNPR